MRTQLFSARHRRHICSLGWKELCCVCCDWGDPAATMAQERRHDSRRDPRKREKDATRSNKCLLRHEIDAWSHLEQKGSCHDEICVAQDSGGRCCHGVGKRGDRDRRARAGRRRRRWSWGRRHGRWTFRRGNGRRTFRRGDGRRTFRRGDGRRTLRRGDGRRTLRWGRFGGAIGGGHFAGADTSAADTSAGRSADTSLRADTSAADVFATISPASDMCGALARRSGTTIATTTPPRAGFPIASIRDACVTSAEAAGQARSAGMQPAQADAPSHAAAASA